MAKGKGQIGLTIAERNPPTSTSFNYRGNALEQWVRDLPLGNVGAMSKLLYNALREVNRLAISWRDRQRFLELLRQPAEYVQQQLQQRYTGIAFPLPPKTQQVVELAKALSGEMALGYKTAIEEMLASSFLSRDNKALIELIHRAVHYLSCALLTSYKTYSSHPEDTWFELHMLYLHAEHKGVHTKRIKDSENRALPKSSIARLYKQILLLALASPYRMRQGEAHAVYHALARWAGHAHIIPYNDPSAAEALFVVHMDSDDSPDFQAFDHRDCNTELCRLVDTRQLSHVLQEELEQLRSDGKNDEGISAELLYRLIRCWGVAPKRSFSRNDKDATLEVVVGLSSLHRALATERGDQSQLLRDKAQYQSKSVVGVSQPTNNDIWNIFSRDKLSHQYDNYKKQTEPKPEKVVEKVVRQNWQIRNESAGGYRLAIEQNDGAKVQVGELLGLRHRYSEQPCEAGVIRWMRQPADGGLELGVQVLAPEVVPVMLHNTKRDGKAAESQPALLLPAVAAIGLPATLLTPILLFEVGMELQLHHPEQDIRIVLVERGQQTGSFTQFRFESKAEAKQQVDLKKKLTPPGDQAGLSIDWEGL
ncbi:MAG: hypothetical protein OQL08_09670 [Gammaproteobacteria bacterium]|nr:hypothetical protein [Gammaproteobacteria bacterium]